MKLGNIDIDFEKFDDIVVKYVPCGKDKLFETQKKLIEDYKAQGVYSTGVTDKTLDESPMAYKNKDEIVASISPTVEIVKTVKPVYYFIASE